MLCPPPMFEKFLSRVAAPEGYEVLFDYLPDVYFFVKDGERRFMRVNRAFLRLVGAQEEEEVLGRRDADFFTKDLADTYARSDHEVLIRGVAVLDTAELVRSPNGTMAWFLTTKLPVLDKAGRVMGLCGFTRDVTKMNVSNAQVLSWAPVIQLMLDNYARPLATPELAQQVGLSVSQFNRQFRRRFRTTPHAYIANLRLQAACRLLVDSSLTISQIALTTGFYDQSHLTNQFASSFGMPPAKYRTLHQPGTG
jgi:PAS domain S-box-containing protein